jgi:hypothetical protein
MEASSYAGAVTMTEKMQNRTDDVFNKWAAKPEWEKQARRFYPYSPEWEFKALKIASLIAAMLSWPFRGWKRKAE